MPKQYKFRSTSVNEELTNLKTQWLKSLTGPQDGMWESFRNSANHIEIRYELDLIGYACIGDDNLLIQFYVLPGYLGQGTEIFKRFIREFNIKKGLIGTNNPVYLSLALHFSSNYEIHTYLFQEHNIAEVDEKEGNLNKCRKDDLQTMVDFYHYSLDASKEWLSGYLQRLIGKGEVFSFENNGEIIGACEVRRSSTYIEIADIGMIVSPAFRKQGYGTFLLDQAKLIAMRWNKIPICSCEKANIGSLKSILNSGFISKYMLLSIVFD